MARDYGRNRPARRGNTGSKQFLMVLLAFLVGYLTASVFDFVSLSHWVNAKLLAQQTNANTPVAHAAVKPAPAPKPKFEFYTLLANGRTVTPSAPVKPVATLPTVINKPQPLLAAVQPTENKPNISVSSAKESYIIQVGSFKTHPEAERMKATLILKGFSASIVPIAQAQVTWFRVIIGPYANQAEAQKAQSDFARNEHVRGMIRKASV